MDPLLFHSPLRCGKKTPSILDPMERTVERGGGHSSDSTDGAKERMMIEWGKARQREREGDGEEEPDTQRGKGRKEGRR